MTPVENLTIRVVAWVESRLGTKILMDRKERAARLLEEALELAQAEGVPEILATNLARRVYDRPVGEPRQEAAGVGVCYLAYCHATDLAPLDVVAEEMTRVEGVDPAVTRARHDFKAAAGLALPAEKP